MTVILLSVFEDILIERKREGERKRERDRERERERENMHKLVGGKNYNLSFY